MGWDFRERRDFKRITIPATANIFADDESGNHLGRIRMLGRGGLLLETIRRFPPGEILIVTIVAEHDRICRQVHMEQRYTSPDGHVGFEFNSLDTEAAVAIGVLINKYRAPGGDQ